jgi:hypothetical protein
MLLFTSASHILEMLEPETARYSQNALTMEEKATLFTFQAVTVRVSLGQAMFAAADDECAHGGIRQSWQASRRTTGKSNTTNALPDAAHGGNVRKLAASSAISMPNASDVERSSRLDSDEKRELYEEHHALAQIRQRNSSSG